MTRQDEVASESKAARRDKLTVRACNGGLVGAIERSGGLLLGFSARIEEWECLLTLRAEFPAGRMISFVGSEDLAGALIKAVRQGNSDGLAWKADKWAK